jgi:hypothetical protein
VGGGTDYYYSNSPQGFTDEGFLAIFHYSNPKKKAIKRSKPKQTFFFFFGIPTTKENVGVCMEFKEQ